MATPFVQGRLRREYLEVEAETECRCCGRGLRLRIDSEMIYEVLSEGAKPLVFEPDVDWSTFEDPSIIHAF